MHRPARVASKSLSTNADHFIASPSTTHRTPLLLLDITLLAGLPVGEIIIVIIADIMMVVTGLIAGLHPSLKYRWGFYGISCLAMLFVFYVLVTSARSYAFLRSPKVGNLFNQVSLALLVVWSLYPVVWAFSEGTGKVSKMRGRLLWATAARRSMLTTLTS